MTVKHETPLNYDTEDATAWAAAYHEALERDPEIVGTVEGTAGWHATLIEIGRRQATQPSS